MLFLEFKALISIFLDYFAVVAISLSLAIILSFLECDFFLQLFLVLITILELRSYIYLIL